MKILIISIFIGTLIFLAIDSKCNRDKIKQENLRFLEARKEIKVLKKELIDPKNKELPEIRLKIIEDMKNVYDLLDGLDKFASETDWDPRNWDRVTVEQWRLKNHNRLEQLAKYPDSEGKQRLVKFLERSRELIESDINTAENVRTNNLNSWYRQLRMKN